MRRFFWIKRVSVFAVLFLAAIAGSWWAWDVRERRRLDAEIAEWNREGLPTEQGEMKQSSLADERNGAVVIRAAIDAWTHNRLDVSGMIQSADATPWPADIMRAAEATLAANGPALDMIRTLPSFDRVEWPGLRASEAFGSAEMSRLSGSRNLANLVSLDSEVAIQRNDSGRFLDDLIVLESLRQGLRQQHHVIWMLVADGIGALRVTRMAEYGRLIKFDDATKIQAWKLIADDLQSRHPMDGCEAALIGDAGVLYEYLMGSPGPSFPANQAWRPNGQWRILRPLRSRNIAIAMQQERNDIAATRAPSFAAARRLITSSPKLPHATVELSEAILLAFPHIEDTRVNLMIVEYRMAAARRMAAVNLASWLYAADHGGKFPRSLAAMVPGYMPLVPVDPFSPTNAPLGYRFDSSGRPYVYSILEKQTDLIATGAYSPVPADHNNFSRPHAVMFIEPPHSPTPATLPAVFRAQFTTTSPSGSTGK